jgi:hypothetical protein
MYKFAYLEFSLYGDDASRQVLTHMVNTHLIEKCAKAPAFAEVFGKPNPIPTRAVNPGDLTDDGNISHAAVPNGISEVVDVSVEVVSRAKSNGIFGDEPACCLVVVSGAVKIESRFWIELASRVLEPIRDWAG